MNRTVSLVVTTIFEPTFLDGYLTALRTTELAGLTRVVIIPDRKTPASVGEAAAAARQNGLHVECPTLAEQEDFLRRLGVPQDFIPYDSDNRRNIGFLMALKQGCEVVISIDDDNYCLPASDFVGGHCIVGRSATDPMVCSSDGWFNICSLLQSTTGESGEKLGETGGAKSGTVQGGLFPRGFPYFAQRADRRVEFQDPRPSFQKGKEASKLTIAMNAGLWLDDPDVDAVSRLAKRPRIATFNGPSVALGPDVWSPINTQNTALTRQAALTYYYVRMGHLLQGLTIDRFGDILSGYLTQKCVKHLGQAIRVGTPIVEHRRTPHNLFKDLYYELAGIVLIEDFVPWLIAEPLEGGTYLDAYQSLAARMLDAAERFRGFIWDEGGRDFLRATARAMQTWAKLVRRWA